MGLFDTIANSIGGTTVKSLNGALEGKLKGLLPSNAGSLVDLGKNVLSQKLGVEGVASSILNSNILRSNFPLASNLLDQALFMNTPSPVFGGITPQEAKNIYSKIASAKHSRKNLFLLEIADLTNAKDGSRDGIRDGIIEPGYDGIDGTFNLFATEVSYSPWTITGEKRKVGGVSIDTVNASEPMDMRITTLDDEKGALKKWFAGKCKQAVHSDGTVGVPADYLVKVSLLHSFINSKLGKDGYRDVVYMRPANIDMDLSRRENAMQEITMTFVQFDNFYLVENNRS